jgi:hypothetical protein
VSVATSIGAGAWVGLTIGLLFGVVLGALGVWAAGALLDWQREIAFTLGVTRQLLPFGAQVALLRGLSDGWALAIPLAGLLCGLVGAIFGGLTGGILAAAYNRSPRHATVVVELPLEDRIVEHVQVRPGVAEAPDQAQDARRAGARQPAPGGESEALPDAPSIPRR